MSEDGAVARHTMSTAQALAEINSSLTGIAPEEAEMRLQRFGPNELVEKKGKTALSMLLDQFSDFLIMILIAAALISGFIGEQSVIPASDLVPGDRPGYGNRHDDGTRENRDAVASGGRGKNAASEKAGRIREKACLCRDRHLWRRFWGFRYPFSRYTFSG
ncbi:MAG: cation-transporting P-type ATPase [Desulfobacterales bacterium]|jgi:hypothetical protein|nr:cation-transporting P-type ATPase [Desulfobacterales bacterium]